MSRLGIKHRTEYLYTRPVQLNRHRLVLRPREGHDLRVRKMILRIQPAHVITWVRDVYGNSVAWVDFSEPTQHLVIESLCTVERLAPFPERTLHEPLAVSHPVLYDPLEQTVVAAYLAPSFPEDGETLRQWLLSAHQIDATDVEGSVLRLAQFIKTHITYLRRMEKGVQSPSTTLSLRSGSCRDMAVLLMECARSLGIAARFVSGYLHGTASLAGRASTHAWAEIYLPALGWRGFDPTLGAATSLAHVAAGVSHHPRGVMPISGSYRGTRADFEVMRVGVKTVALS